MEGLSIIQRREIAAAFKNGPADFEKNGFYKVQNQIFALGGYGSSTMDARYAELGVKGVLGAIPRQRDRFKPYPLIDAPNPKILTVEASSYRGAYAYLWEDLQDDKMGYYKEMASSLAQAALFTRELIAHDMFNRAKDSTLPQGWDGLTLANAAHPLLNPAAGTYSNTIAAAAPSETILQSVMDYFDKIPDHQGRPNKASTKIVLLVHISKLRAWRQILNSPTAITNVAAAQLTSTSPNPNPQIPNYFQSDNVTVIGTPYFTATDLNSFIAIAPGINGLYWRKRFTREGLFDDNNPPKTTHFVWDKFTCGSVDHRAILVVGF